MQGSKYIAAAGVAGAALMLLRRAMRSNLVTGRNRLKLLTPIPEDIEISQAVKLTPVRARVETKAFMAGQRGPSRWLSLAPPCPQHACASGRLQPSRVAVLGLWRCVMCGLWHPSPRRCASLAQQGGLNFLGGRHLWHLSPRRCASSSTTPSA